LKDAKSRSVSATHRIACGCRAVSNGTTDDGEQKGENLCFLTDHKLATEDFIRTEILSVFANN
jgi:hypothetical protein